MFWVSVSIVIMRCLECQVEVDSNKIHIHWRKFHERQAGFFVDCPECSVRFTTRPSYQKHWYAKHHVREDSNAVPSVSTSTSSSPPPSKRLCVEEQSTPQDAALGLPPAPVDFSDSASADIQQDHGHEVVSVEDAVPESVPEQVASGKGSDTECDESDNSEVEFVCDSDDDNGELNEESDCDSESDVPLMDVFQQLSLQKKSTPPQSVKINPQASSFVLNVRDKCLMPDKAVLGLIHEAEGLVESALHEFSAKVKEVLKAKGVDLDNVMNVEETLQDAANVFENLKSTKKQNKHFEDKLNFVKPEPIPLGRAFKKKRGAKMSGMKVVIVGHELVSVPLKGAMDKLVNHPDYQYFVEEGKRSRNTKYLDSYMKGEKCKKNKFLEEHPDALRFVLYYDDLEACSPLKSKSGVHKIGAFYLYVENIPLKFRSQLSSIMLLALVNANYLSGDKYGIDAALEHIKLSLQEFENGVMLPSGKYVFGTLIAVIGDNKGSNAIGGFKEGFTAHRPCRTCSATLAQVRSMSRENPKLFRDIESHKEQCDKVQTNKGKNEKLSTEFGVNRDAILNSLETYHVIGGLPPDIMNDILEGSLPLTIKKLLNHFLYKVKEKPFTLEWLNEAIEDFDYGFAEVSSKPSVLKKEYLDVDDNSTKLHQSASQTWMLATILPMIIGPLIDEDDKYYENFLDILEISRIVFTVEIVPWMVSYLQDLIEKYLLDYMSLYGELIPKQHHMIHYPLIILQMGSLVLWACLRMEAKHKYFKDLVKVLGNYKNIYWSLGLKHQIHQAVQWSKSLKPVNRSGPCSQVDRNECLFKHILPPQMTSFVESKWLIFEGNKFVAGECFICIGYDDETGPTLLKVLNIIIHPSIAFICQKVATLCRNIQLASYEVKVLDELCIANPTMMTYHSVLHAHVVRGSLHVAFKYCAGGEIF